jgi:hypothetical protein
MIKKIKNFILSGMLLLMVATPAAVPSAVAFAGTPNCSGVPESVAGGASTASGGSITCDNVSGNDTAVTSAVGALATKVVNIFTIIVGAASVIMIVYGGFRYITSGGSSERVGAAKNTLIYAIIGLIIVGLAQILVHFVLSQSANTGGQSFG